MDENYLLAASPLLERTMKGHTLIRLIWYQERFSMCSSYQIVCHKILGPQLVSLPASVDSVESQMFCGEVIGEAKWKYIIISVH
ncbi:hypothetical protein FCM35_KLT14312 [Carex littledalei]|uniref:Uncharacterized protein n=1 Tax=Carex littledalei TaxID=544730 RepID=A0A833VDT0_9POAL|nr:hypothetical protein FCM35_KLT14312 [Carex littledalei]